MSTWTWAHLKTLLGFKKEYANTDYIAVVWPVAYPSEYPQPVEPHCTIVMLGTTDVANFTKEEVLDAIRETHQWNSFLFTKVSHLEWFGENKDIPVLRLDHKLLEEYHNRLKSVLLARGFPVDMRFPEYKPHCTISPEIAESGIHPHRLMLTPVQLWWGGEHISVKG